MLNEWVHGGPRTRRWENPQVVVLADVVGFGIGVIAFIIWVLLAFWPARVAGRKGHSFIGFFIFSVIFFPAALIVAYVVRDRRVVVRR
jgi:hypothetical protein